LITFYFDFLSPYAYIAWTQIQPLALRHGRRVEPAPVLLAGLLNAHGQKGPAEIPAKRAYVFKDVLRKAHRLVAEESARLGLVVDDGQESKSTVAAGAVEDNYIVTAPQQRSPFRFSWQVPVPVDVQPEGARSTVVTVDHHDNRLAAAHDHGLPGIEPGSGNGAEGQARLRHACIVIATERRAAAGAVVDVENRVEGGGEIDGTERVRDLCRWTPRASSRVQRVRVPLYRRRTLSESK